MRNNVVSLWIDPPTVSPAEVRELRIEMEISQEMLARKRAMATSVGRAWESGKHAPSVRWLRRLRRLMAEHEQTMRRRELKQA